jgi:cysteinyl-tRNA synthetase
MAHVYFAVMKHAGYGKLSGRDLAEQQQNADGRVSISEEARKHHPFDFALWKGAKPGEPSFPSPWGAGRPGSAHRMLGDGAPGTGRHDRHPSWRC